MVQNPSAVLARCTSRNAIDKWVAEMSQRYWCKAPGQRQIIIKECMLKFARNLLQRGGTARRILVGLFTRRRRLNRNILNLKLVKKAIF